MRKGLARPALQQCFVWMDEGSAWLRTVRSVVSGGAFAFGYTRMRRMRWTVRTLFNKSFLKYLCEAESSLLNQVSSTSVWPGRGLSAWIDFAMRPGPSRS